MKHLLTIISCLLALNLTAQEVVVEYPYNPDFENDGNVGVEDLMQLLASFGMGFDVDEITIDEVALSEWLQAISETLVAQQTLVDSLMSNEANSGIGQLDSALIADMINEAGSATVSFGERVHLGEPADWGPLPWDEYVNYGTYEFDDAGIFMGFFKYPFYDIYLLHDTIDVQELSASQLQDHHSVAQTSNGTESFSVALGVDERIVVRGLPNSFGASDDYNFDWVPLSTSSLDAASEAESLGLAFGPLEVYTYDNLESYPEFPGNQSSSSIVTHLDFNADGFLRIVGNGCGSIKYAFIPDTVTGPVTGDDLASEFPETYSESADDLDMTFPLPQDMQLVFINENGFCGNQFSAQWTPLVASGATSNDDIGIDQSIGPCQGEQSVNYHGYEYDLVEIGDQCWFAEDLQTSTFSNGDEIPTEWNWANFDDPWAMPSCEDHGGWIYNGPARIDERNLCPTDFRIPDESDWSELMGELYGQHLTAGHMNHSGINLHGGHQDYNNDAIGDCVDLSTGGGYYGLEYDQVVLPQGTYSTYTGAYVLGNQWEYLEANQALGMFIRCIRD